MNAFTHYTRLWVNRRSRRAWRKHFEGPKYRWHYRQSWQRFQRSFPQSVSEVFGVPTLPEGEVTIEVVSRVVEERNV